MTDDRLFRKESLEHITTPQQMDSYIVVTRSGWWFLLAALLILFAGLFIWGAVGSIPETVGAKALVVDENHLLCYLPVADNNAELVGKQVSVSVPRGENHSYSGHVYKVSQTPFSRQEIASTITSDWQISNLVTSDYADRVSIVTDDRLPLPTDSICDVTILVARIKPIHYIVK